MQSNMTRYLIPCACLVVAVLLTGDDVLAQSGSMFKNPASVESVEKFIERVLQAVVYIALPIIALFMVYAGFLFVKARGSSSDIEEAKKNFSAVVIGAILILGAWVFATLIAGTVSQILRGS